MKTRDRIPDASAYRLSLYHCYLGEVLRTQEAGRITSRQIADELGVKEETVRRDLSFVGGVGRPGAGYEVDRLFDALQEFLGLRSEYPIVEVGTTQMLEALTVVFPASSYGVKPVAYFSELPADAGGAINDITVGHIDDIASLDPTLDVKVALVACSPAVVEDVLRSLSAAGVEGVLLLTPKVKLLKPEGMTVTHVRMPCDIKSLACRCQVG